MYRLPRKKKAINYWLNVIFTQFMAVDQKNELLTETASKETKTPRHLRQTCEIVLCLHLCIALRK